MNDYLALSKELAAVKRQEQGIIRKIQRLIIKGQPKAPAAKKTRKAKPVENPTEAITAHLENLTAGSAFGIAGVAKATGVDPKVVGVVVSRLAKKGTYRKIGRGRWEVA